MKAGLFLMVLGAAMVFAAVEYGLGDYGGILQGLGITAFAAGILSVVIGQFRRRQ